MLAIALAALLSQTPAPEEPERFPFSPELNAVYEDAFQALQGGKVERAGELLPKLLEGARENPRTWRFAAMVYFGQQKQPEMEEAIQKSIELGIDDRRKADLFELRAAMDLVAAEKAAGPERSALERKAEDALRLALDLHPESAAGNYYAAVLAYERKQYAVARQHAEAAVAAAPNGDAYALLAAADAKLEDFEAAADAAVRARELGEIRSFFQDVEERGFKDRWFRRAWQGLLASAVLLAAGLFVLWAAGSALSKMQLGKLEAGQAALLRAEQTPSERAAGRIYDGVLWFGSGMFYASIPLMLIVTVGTGAVMLWGLFQLPRIPVKLILIAVLVAFGGLYAVIRGIFIKRAADEGGRVLAEAEEPKLFAALREVSEVATSRMVDRVHLESDVGIGVREAGGFWEVLLGRGKRVLHLGYGAAAALTASELKSVLAHEYGHFSHGETRLNPVISRVTASGISMFQQMAQVGGAKLNPVFWFLRLYLTVYFQVTAAHSRRRELLADRSSALAYGGETFGRSLTKVVRAGEVFDRAAVGLVVMLRQAGRPCRNLYRCVDAAGEVSPAKLREARFKANLEREEDKYASHPPPQERIARVAGIPAQRPADDAPATSLFSDPEKLAEELTALLVMKVDAVLAERGEAAKVQVELEPNAQARLSAALALHQDGIELQEKADPEAAAVLAEAVRRIEADAGQEDPLVAPALVALSKSQAGTDKSVAIGTMERAIGIVEKKNGPGSLEALELRRALEALRGPASP